jgi:hypothetical protein
MNRPELPLRPPYGGTPQERLADARAWEAYVLARRVERERSGILKGPPTVAKAHPPAVAKVPA